MRLHSVVPFPTVLLDQRCMTRVVFSHERSIKEVKTAEEQYKLLFGAQMYSIAVNRSNEGVDEHSLNSNDFPYYAVLYLSPSKLLILRTIEKILDFRLYTIQPSRRVCIAAFTRAMGDRP